METNADSAHPLKRFSAKALDRSKGEKFLLFDVFEVENPKAIPVAFTVYYRAAGQDRRYLGSFSLYPADNPGRFLVSTQGKIGKDGEVLLYLVSLDETESVESVHVKLREVTLVDRLDPK